MASGKILVVEDNPMNLEIATDLLQEAGYQPFPAEDAESAIRQLPEIQPDLILLDLHLPGKDGYETCRIIKSMPDFKGVPVIAFTALAMAEDQRKAFDCGCSGVISKPIDVDTFAQTVETFLGKADGQSENGSREETESSGFSPSTQEKTQAATVSTPSRFLPKPHFMTMLSHDLRTPVFSAYTALQVLAAGRAGQLNPEQQRLVDEILESNRYLQRLMETLLEIYRYEDGRVSLKKSPVNIKNVVEKELGNTVNSLAQGKDIRFNASFQPEIPEISADADKLGQAIRLMVENAVIGAPKGTTIEINTARESDQVAIHISDSEQFIAEDDLALVFDASYDLTGKKFRQPGRSLSLFLARVIIREHQGELLGECMEPSGCRFTILLPMHA